MRARPNKALQFQSPVRSVGITRSGDNYTLTRNIGSGRTWEVDLTELTTTAGTLHRIDGSRIVGGAEPFVIHDTFSATDFAITDNDVGTFVGAGHGNERQTTALAITVDGDVATPTDGQTLTGTEVAVARQTELLTAGGHVSCLVESIYTMTHEGLDVDRTFTWVRSVPIGRCYLAMFPTSSGAFDTGRTLGGSIANLTDDDGTAKSPSQSDAALMWESTGNHGVCLWLRDLSTVLDWEYSDGQDLWLQDRAEGINKVYAGFRLNSTVTPGTVWTSAVRYMADYFDGGAAATLAT